MVALLRQGERRIACSMLKRSLAAVTSTAVAEEGRRLLPKRMYSSKEQARGRIECELQQKKDELYDLINEGEDNVRTSTLANAWLLRYLSGEVTPRPYCSNWRDLQETRKTVGGIKRAGFFSLAFVVPEYYSFYSNDNKVEGEDEASEVETRSPLTGN